MCALSRLADLMLLNLAALVCSLPVLTIGASAAALFAAVRDLINERGGSILRAYFVHWRREARRATLLFLPFLLPFAVILFDLLLLYQHPSAPLLDRGLLAASAVAFLGVYLGSLQMFAYFDDSIHPQDVAQRGEAFYRPASAYAARHGAAAAPLCAASPVAGYVLSSFPCVSPSGRIGPRFCAATDAARRYENHIRFRRQGRVTPWPAASFRSPVPAAP